MARKISQKKAKDATASKKPECQQEVNPSTEDKPEVKPFVLKDLFSAIAASLSNDPPENADKQRDVLIHRYLGEGLKGHNITQNYNILLLHDEGIMVKSDADNIYSAAAAFTEKKPLLLILYSTGGEIGSAYLIGKLCREYSNDKFAVVIPRQAKSAATLICCAADEIHMGSLSELGPIDPQIDRMPALGLKSSIEHIADLVKSYPQSSDMFAQYLNLSLKPIHLGYYERVAESAAQYAERLLKLHKDNLVQKTSKIANDLVYSYKDHGFVIDKSEACDIFGHKVVQTNTPEYNLGNDLYKRLTLISRLADAFDSYFYFIGPISAEPHFAKKKR